MTLRERMRSGLRLYARRWCCSGPAPARALAVTLALSTAACSALFRFDDFTYDAGDAARDQPLDDLVDPPLDEGGTEIDVASDDSGSESDGGCMGCWSGSSCQPGTAPAECGQGGISCVVCGVNADCPSGSCRCMTPWDDCNMNLADGCEADLSSDPVHCGACSTNCGATPCMAGVCTSTTCAPGTANCDALPDCETNVDTDPMNCGLCRHLCGMNTVCTGGNCACALGFGDCDFDIGTPGGNGCETPIDADPVNCGACGSRCDDRRPCTMDGCSSGACTHTDLNGVACIGVPGTCISSACARILDGELAYDHFGSSLSYGVDADSDGRADALIGASGLAVDGKAYLYSLAPPTRLRTWTGAGGEEMGRSVSLGDVNGDGVADALIGSPQWVSSGTKRPGRAQLFAPALTASASSTWPSLGLVDGDLFGAAVSIGPYISSSCGSIAVGSPGYSSTMGRVFVFSFDSMSNNPTLLRTIYGYMPAAGEDFGASVSVGPDVDATIGGTTCGEIAVGSPGVAGMGGALVNSGRAYVFHGGNASYLWFLDGATGGERLGEVLSFGGDANGDRIADVLVGAPAASLSAGEATLYSGVDRAIINTWSGAVAGEGLGTAVSVGPDSNLDGIADFVAVGLPGPPSGPGRVQIYVYSRAGSWTEARSPIVGESANDHFGVSVALGPDVDGDGLADLLVAATYASPSGMPQAGRVYFFGSAGW